MPSFSFLEEFSVIRAKYKTAFSDLMQAAARTTGTDVRHKYVICWQKTRIEKNISEVLSMMATGHFKAKGKDFLDKEQPK